MNYQTDSFSEIASLYQAQQLDPRTTLLVCDLDDTLITMTQDLGGVGWWDWQYGLQQHGSKSDKLFTPDYQQLIRIQNLLFQLIKMEVTDEYVLPFLKGTTNQGATIMGLTARGKEYLSTTFMQLKDNQFVSGNKLLFEEKGLKFNNNKTSLAGSVECPQFDKEVIYQRGILFLDGEDKGQALLCALSKTKKEIKTIVFIDDSHRNIVSVDKAFSTRDDLLTINIFYTKENAKELEVRTNPMLQEQLFKQWMQIKSQINEVVAQSTV